MVLTKFAPMGDPLELNINGYELTLRLADAGRIQVEDIAEPGEHENKESSSSVFTNGKLSIDYNAGLVMIDKEEIHLTPIEYKLLCVMAQNIGRVLTHNFILKEVWNNTLPNDTQSLRVYMASLRTKVEPLLGEKIIQTHVGIGYRMIKL